VLKKSARFFVELSQRVVARGAVASRSIVVARREVAGARRDPNTPAPACRQHPLHSLDPLFEVAIVRGEAKFCEFMSAIRFGTPTVACTDE